MEQEDLRREVDYRLSKMLLLNLLNDGLLTLEEAEEVRKAMVERYNPPIGCLDGGTEWEG